MTQPFQLLIDGYNLMFECYGAPDARHGKQALRKARERMLDDLASRLSESDRLSTCIVFDSADETGLPSSVVYRSTQLLFARDEASADDLLIEAIRRHPHPKSLTVVTSDHRIQRVAAANSALFFDCDDWLAQDWSSQARRVTSTSNPSASSLPNPNDQQAERDEPEISKAQPKLNQPEIDRWLREFGL
jgi:uncharacterized protein